VIRAHTGSEWSTEVVPGLQRFFMLPRYPGGSEADAVSVSAVDRNGNESTPVIVAIIPSR
jgi:hypothetical protein